MILWFLGSLFVFLPGLPQAWCIIRLPRKSRRSFRTCFLRVMDLGFINYRRILQVSLQVSYLWLSTSPIFQFYGMNYRIMNLFLHVLVRSVCVMWMRRSLISITEKLLCNFWWVSMTLSLTFEDKSCWWILFHLLRKSSPCWFKIRSKDQLGTTATMVLLWSP